MCGDEKAQQGVNDVLIYTSSHTALGCGQMVAAHPRCHPTAMTHGMEAITTHTWFVTGKSSAKCPEQAVNDWQGSVQGTRHQLPPAASRKCLEH